jgi:hypothetical protein
MSRKVYSLTLLLACASSVLASAQVPSSPTDDKSSFTSPVAYIYVSSSPSSGVFHIYGYRAASNGQLTAIPGSPFAANGLYYMAVNGKYMFGAYQSTIYSLSIASNGSLNPLSQVSTNSEEDLYLASLDHTGSTLYAGFLDGSGNNGYDFYSVNNSTGALSLIGGAGTNPNYGLSPLAFIADNVYAYSSNCSSLAPQIFGFERSSNGNLTALNILPPMPTGENYCPFKAAPDTSNHVAIPVWNTSNSTGPWQIAVYTSDSSGNLTTTSTSANMPYTATGNVQDIWPSPSGKYLAVGGTKGLQLFHFNGANPITKFTNALVTNEIDQVFWDNSNHLYGIDQLTGKLYVFSVTSTGATQAPGSPYTIPGGWYIIVQPK